MYYWGRLILDLQPRVACCLTRNAIATAATCERWLHGCGIVRVELNCHLPFVYLPLGALFLQRSEGSNLPAQYKGTCEATGWLVRTATSSARCISLPGYPRKPEACMGDISMTPEERKVGVAAKLPHGDFHRSQTATPRPSSIPLRRV